MMRNAKPLANARARKEVVRQQSAGRSGVARAARAASLAIALLIGWSCAASAQAPASPADRLAQPAKMEAEVDPASDAHLRMALATRRAWSEGDFATLEAFAGKAQDLSARDSGGLTEAATFGAQLMSQIRYPGPAADASSDKSGCECAPAPSQYSKIDAEWAKVGAKIDKWIALYPNSSTAYIVKANYFHKKGGFFRGGGYAIKVLPEAWPIVRQNLRLEGEALGQSYEINKKNPLWYPAALSWMGYGNASPDAIIKVISAMASQKMAFAEPFIVAMYFMEPRWGGSYEGMDQMARIADIETMSADFGSTYARVYWGLATGYDLSLRDSFFQKTKADWPKMKKSFDVMVKLFPSSRNYSGYAFFACQAGDAPLARSLLIKAGSVEYFESQTRGQWPICEPEQWRAK